jgi:wyosine [tRNA(Phe)-imidazoG37] synthetase (radical SAM superfamily)
MLSITDHRRDRLGLKYIYPVFSRRAGGLSIGINLNTNNACNWRCIYCQVPGLVRGSAPDVDFDLLTHELKRMLAEILHGDFYKQFDIPESSRNIQDIAIAGNGEPTSCRDFDQVVELIGNIADESGLLHKIRIVLITNGSFMHRPAVRKGIERLSQLNGEIWFKLDSATNTGLQLINNAGISIIRVTNNLKLSANLCPTWIQTCVFALDEKQPSDEEQDAYLKFISGLLECGTPLKGIQLYGIARQSHQPEAPRLSRLPLAWLEEYAEKIRTTGIDVKISE